MCTRNSTALLPASLTNRPYRDNLRILTLLHLAWVGTAWQENQRSSCHLLSQRPAPLRGAWVGTP